MRNNIFKVGGPIPWSRVLLPFYRKKLDRSTQFGAVGYIITLYSSKSYVKSWGVHPNFLGVRTAQWLRPSMQVSCVWSPVSDLDERFSVGEYEQYLLESGAFIFYGTERFLDYLPPHKLASMSLPSKIRISFIIEEFRLGFVSLTLLSRLSLTERYFSFTAEN